MKVGDKVISKRTGLPASGIVVGILVAPLYANKFGHVMTRWDELYPDWKDSLVVFLKFDKPQKPVTFEEFNRNWPPDAKITEEERQTLYKYNVPYAEFVAYPIDDLEILE